MFNRIKRLFLLFLLCFWGAAAYSVDPPESASRLFLDFSKSVGLADAALSESMPDNSAQELEGVDLQRNHNLSRRMGYNDFVRVPGVAYGGFNNLVHVFKSTAGCERILYRDGRKTVKDYPYNTNSVGSDFQEFSVGFGEADFVRFGGASYLVTESSPGFRFYHKYSTACSGFLQSLGGVYVPAIPRGKYAQTHLDRLLVAGVSTAPLTIFYSEENEPENFDVANTIEIPATKDTAITGIGPTIFGNALVYGENSTRLLSGNVFPSAGTGGNISVRTISDTIGAVHHKTIKNFGSGRQYFLSSGNNGIAPGIYYFNGVGIVEATKHCRDFFKGINTSSSGIIPNAYVTEDEYCVYVASKAGIYPNIRVCIDLNNRITVSSGTPVAHTDTYKGVVYGITANESWDAQNIFYIGLNNKDMLESNSAFTKNINWRYKTKDYRLSTGLKTSVADRAYVNFESYSGTFTVVANFDFGQSSAVFVVNTSSLANASNNVALLGRSNPNRSTRHLRFPNDKKFTYVNFDFFGNDSSTSSINYFDFYFRQEETITR